MQKKSERGEGFVKFCVKKPCVRDGSLSARWMMCLGFRKRYDHVAKKLFNLEWQITSKSFLLSPFLIGFSFSPTAEISSLELEVEERFAAENRVKEGIGQESNGAANQEKQIFLLCQISPSASSTRDLGTRLHAHLPPLSHS